MKLWKWHIRVTITTDPLEGFVPSDRFVKKLIVREFHTPKYPSGLWKISPIKVLRELHPGYGLKEAKERVEQVYERYPKFFMKHGVS